MPRFVILEHHHEGLHWDFMLETGGVLRTWRLERPPRVCDARIAATPLPDHRLTYLEYEGEVSGGRGRVARWDAGEFEWFSDLPQSVEVQLFGERVRGRVYLDTDESGRWSLRFTPVEPERGGSAAR